ncbi:hypothetical protein [Microbacterium sp. NIBRBAC000506063]|uniref:hypothetical protein n=1 Tax=Microbacterium sp. NIBRBAC000506063 TaxID=2734618 RepID=UPI001BB4F432|nr:hypothetical protein [Microbacterium sp. NIBRBAC000506063]QTV79940.1 hypothetical protein KAE78_01840 [Microbacterium sp. NIBRBAC000506063]
MGNTPDMSAFQVSPSISFIAVAPLTYSICCARRISVSYEACIALSSASTRCSPSLPVICRPASRMRMEAPGSCSCTHAATIAPLMPLPTITTSNS